MTHCGTPVMVPHINFDEPTGNDLVKVRKGYGLTPLRRGSVAVKRHSKRRDPSDKVVKAVISGEWRDTPEAAEAHDAAWLLSVLADALNGCERAGITVKLAHGAVLTPVGYVLPVYQEAGGRFAVRTMALAEFPVDRQVSDDD